MDKKRRQIISGLLAAGLGGSTALKAFGKIATDSLKQKGFKEQDDIFYHIAKNYNNPILAPGLKKGSKMAVIAPASHASIWELRNFGKAMESLGIKTEYGDTIKNYNSKYGYLSAPDAVRAKELMDTIKRDDIDAIMACRGGYGVMRILKLLDFDEIRDHPKIIVGYSDITALLNAVYKMCNIVTFHGPVAISTFNGITMRSFKDTLFHTNNFEPIVYKDSRIETLNGGKAQGKLIGGNLTMVDATLGSPYEIDTEGAILFLEEKSEDPYKIDRMLTHLYIAGKLDKIAGIMFGYYSKLDKRYNFYPYKSLTARQVIERRFNKLGVPAILGLPIGHIKDKYTLPIGNMAELDADKKTLTILEPSVT